MNVLKYRVSLDMFDTLSQVTIKAKKCDSACQIHITLTEHGKVYKINEGCYATFYAKKSDGSIIYDNCTIENNTIVYDFRTSIKEGVCQVSAEEGVVECEVTLYNADSEQLTSPRFTLYIDGTVYNGNEVISTSEADALKKLINEANETVAEIESKLANGEFVGEKGIQGEKGDRGYTPIKGVDYFDGKDGASGVYVGTEEPTDENANVWINPEGITDEPITVEVVKSNNGHTVTITDANNTNTFEVLNGKDGSQGVQGEKGADGYTPQKGVDYWTDEDKAEMGIDIVPDYVKTAAETIAKTVHRRQSKNSIVFPFITDAHCGWYLDTEHKAIKHLGQALKIIQKRCPLDFVVHGGDMSTGAFSTTVDDVFNDIEDYTELVEGHMNETEIWVIGNHDDAPYQATEGRLTQTDTFALIGRRNLRSGAICNQGVNYGYLDFENRKLRIIYLDTDDKRSWDSVKVDSGECDYSNAHHISAEQLRWLSTTALDFSDKDDATKWGVIVFSHVPLNVLGTFTDANSGQTREYNTANGATILGAYRKGLSGSITINDNTIAYDFTTLEQRADIYCLVHGHNHAYTEGMYEGILSIGCPNAMNGREKASANGTTYTKTEGTATGTAFCIITVDRENNKIYADHYGAGCDREWDYVPYSGVLYTNQLPISTDTDGNVYNGVGYKAGYRLNSSGGETAQESLYTTGFIPCKKGETVYLKGVQYLGGSTTDSIRTNQKFAIYDKDKKFIAVTHAGVIANEWNKVLEGECLTQFKVADTSYGFVADNAAYMRLTASYIDETSIITVNEEIID